MEKEKMFRTTNQYITGNPSQSASLWPQPDQTQSIQLSPSYPKKLEDSRFAWQHHAASMNPSHAFFFWKTCRQKLFSPTHPPRHPTSCLTGCDAKVPRATALHRLGFQCFWRSHRDGYWLPGPCWGQKKG